MLTHLNPERAPIERVIILGGGGFIGGEIARALTANGMSTRVLTRTHLDLVSAGADELLAQELQPRDTLVFVSARAPCKDSAMLIENLSMARAVGGALKQRPVAHVVYISSDAVYKDSDQPLTEASCAEPGSFHGVMHLAREVALRQDYAGPLALVRPTLVYGVNDPHNGYGPNRFRRLAMSGQDISLFGEGEERRDHVDVEDVAELVRLIVQHRSVGVANAVSGEVVSFRTLAEFAASAFRPQVAVTGTARTGPMPHNGYRAFEHSAAVDAFPGFRFKPWREGLARMHAQLATGETA